jgi:hypothetical protein
MFELKSAVFDPGSEPLSSSVSPIAQPGAPLSDPLASASPRSSSPAPVQALAFVDAGLSDYQTLVAGLAPNTAVYLLNSNGNELSQISQVLAGYSNLSSVSLFSHGSNGAVQLGTTSLNTNNLLDYAGLLQSWSSSLAMDADLLLYGCDVAAAATGQKFVQQIAALTGADVAASSDLTGSHAVGGNWSLEFSTGQIEASESLADWAQAAYQQVLATFTVTNTNDSGIGSLRQAILDANANAGADDITFTGSTFTDTTADTITLTTGQLSITGDLTITGTGANRLTVSGNNATRVFNVNAGATASFSGLTISRGRELSGDGGGIYNGGTLTVSNSTLSSNSAGGQNGGGGIYNGGTLTVSNSTLSGNSSSSSTSNSGGGGIYNGGTLTVSNSTLSGNSFSSSTSNSGGGGIYSSGALTVSNSTLSGNSLSGFGGSFSGGGGIYSRSFGGTPTVSNSTLSDNSAGGRDGGGIFVGGNPITVSNSTLSGNSASRGGGIYSSGAPITVSNSTLSGNRAGFSGGGIYSDGSVTVSNSTFSGNRAISFDGGGICSGAIITVSNSTFYGNSADSSSGGGICSYRTVTVSNSIVAGNTASSGREIYSSSTTISGGYNLFGFNGSSGLFNVTTTTGDITPTGALSTILNTTLRNNGGPTPTHALLAGSLAINAGSNTGVSVTDQTGNPRIVNNLVDIGAVESPFDRVSLTAQDAAATEVSGNPGVYRIQRDGTTGTLLVNLRIAGTSTATASDYTFSSNVSVAGSTFSVTIPDGSNFVEVVLTPIFDPSVEGPEALTLNLTSGNYGINPGQMTATVNITDAPVLSITALDAIATELPDNPGTYRITRTGDTSQDLVVDYTMGGTATAGTDYTALTGTATIEAGQSFIDVTLAPTNDNTVEVDEAAILSLSASSNYNIDTAQNTASIAILDAPVVSITAPDAFAAELLENPGIYRITRTITTGDLVVNLTIDGSSTATSGDYTLSGGSVTASDSTLTVTIPDGQSFVDLNLAAIAEAIGFAEGNDTLRLNLAAGSYTSGDSTNATVTIAQNGFVVINTANSSEGSLRQAVLNANAIAGDDTITFAGSTFTDGTADTITLTTGGLGISSNVTINGTGANLLTISGNNASRVFNIASGTVVIGGLTIANGNAGSSSGGGILNAGNLSLTNSLVRNNAARFGGGIQNIGSLTVDKSTFSQNQATAGGAGIDSEGTLIFTNSTLTDNTTDNGAGSGSGGGLQIGSGTATITNATISGNRANGQNDDGGGGIMVYGGSVTVQNSTIYGNSTTSLTGGGGVSNLFVFPGSVNLINTIVAGNTSAANKPDLSGTIASGTNNLIGKGDGSTGLANGVNGNLVGTIANPIDPKLGSLANNGGPTQTHALLAGSLAINAGSNTGVSVTDQSGNPRIVNNLVDLGAVESLFDRVSLTAQDATATEVPGNPGVYRIQRDGMTGNLVVNLTPAGTSTASASDYTFSNNVTVTSSTLTVTIPDGQSFVDVVLTPILDPSVEVDETAVLTLASGNYAISTTNTATVNILDAPVVTVSVLDASASESTPNSGSFRLTRSGDITQALTVNYTLAGTATNGTDYATLAGTATIAAGQSFVDVLVNPTNDTVAEGNETIQLSLATGTYNVGSTSSGTVTLAANDPTIQIAPSAAQAEGNSGTTTHTFTVSLSNASDEAVTVSYATANGTAALADNDYITQAGTLTFNPGVTSQTIMIAVKGDTQFEANETFTVNLSDATKGSLLAANGTATSTIVNDDAATLLWRNGTTGTAPTGTGQNAVWQLNNFTLQSSYFMPTLADLNWQIISTADFNRDGTADILWRNQATGENAIWQMNSTGYQTGYFLTTVADLNWRLLDTGDFNGDGTADLLWRNRATGENAIWQMNGFSTQTTALTTTVADANWQIVSTADFDNDGKTDLLWRNRATGENAIWQMNGFATKSTFFFTTVAIRTGRWQARRT